MVTHSSNLAWRIPWTEEPAGLQPIIWLCEHTDINIMSFSFRFIPERSTCECLVYNWVDLKRKGTVLFNSLLLKVILKLFSLWFIYGLKSKLDRFTTDKSCQQLHRTLLKKGGTKRKCNIFYNKYIIFHGNFSKTFTCISISKNKFL